MNSWKSFFTRVHKDDLCNASWPENLLITGLGWLVTIAFGFLFFEILIETGGMKLNIIPEMLVTSLVTIAGLVLAIGGVSEILKKIFILRCR